TWFQILTATSGLERSWWKITVSPFASTSFSKVIFRMVGLCRRVWQHGSPHADIEVHQHTMALAFKSSPTSSLASLGTRLRSPSGTLALVMVALAALGGQAAADGAFPDSSQILLPATRPHRIVLVTNFGLIISEDDGATWEWACEPRGDDNTILYQQAAAPSDRIFAVLINHGLLYSDD